MNGDGAAPQVKEQPAKGETPAQRAWVKLVLNADTQDPKYTRGAGAPSASAAGAAGPKPKPPVKAEQMFDGAPPANPFDSPQAHVEIEKLALPVLRQLAVSQAQNAFNDFHIAVEKVRSARKAKAEEEEKQRELIYTIAITIALLPAGPLVEAAAGALAGPQVRSKVLEVIVNNAGPLQQKFGKAGAAAANKAFDVIASEAVEKLAAKFDAAAAKSALESGVDKMKDRAVKFAASSDDGKCVTAFLDALLKSAADAMHNLTDVIGTVPTCSGAAAFYKMFSMPLLSSYEAAIDQQVEHMLRELKDVLATRSEPQVLPGGEGGGYSTATEEIVKVRMKGRPLLAHAVRLDSTFMHKPMFSFRAWITPDMQATAVKLVKEEIAFEQFSDSAHVPQPNMEHGERVVRVDVGGKERLMLIDIEDEGIFWIDYGVRTFKQWAEGEEEERVFRTRGAGQLGGIEKIDIKTVKKVPRS